MIIFLSGANITSGGPLEIYRNLLEILNRCFPDQKVIAIISKRELFVKYDNVEYIEVENYKRYIFLKFYYEYFKFNSLSKKYDIKLWLSLNDCSPRVKSNFQAVYCHNATPFYRRSWDDFLNPSGAFLQSFYYGIFYKLFLHRNDFVIVQQTWFKQYFNSKYNVSEEKIIVNPLKVSEIEVKTSSDNPNDKKRFIYPTKAQPYKNTEVILRAVSLLELNNITNFEVILTLTGFENKYSNRLYKKFEHLKCVNWAGQLKRNELERFYKDVDCLLFSSKLETWGLPLTEFSKYNKPILAAKFPYSKETLAGYKYVSFFEWDDYANLTEKMKCIILNSGVIFEEPPILNHKQPYLVGLEDLIDFLIKEQLH
jgi:glycosyltransferase involved in cell wall biosynthesis